MSLSFIICLVSDFAFAGPVNTNKNTYSLQIAQSGGGSTSVIVEASSMDDSCVNSECANFEKILNSYEQDQQKIWQEYTAWGSGWETANNNGGTPPRITKRIEIHSGDTLLGGMTEFIPGSGVFFTARHVLQENSKENLTKAFSAAGIDINKYRFYQFNKGNEVLDAVLAIPHGQESNFLSSEIDTKCNCSDEVKLKLRNLPQFQRTISIGDQYFSYQYGTVGEESVSQSSIGLITQIGTDKYYLDLSLGNSTTARSSGSIVQTRKEKSKAWKFSGIIECYLPETKTRNNVVIPGGVRVISPSALLDSDVSPIPIDSILNEKVQKQDSTIDPCIKIDVRWAGGT